MSHSHSTSGHAQRLTPLDKTGLGDIGASLQLGLGILGAGCLALVARPLASLLPARIAAFFVLVNASMLVAWGHHLRGRRAVLWQPTRR